jgi:cyanate lyase
MVGMAIAWVLAVPAPVYFAGWVLPLASVMLAVTALAAAMSFLISPRSHHMNRNDVTEKIISTKVSKGLQWGAIAKKVGQSKEWTTALCLGQMTATPEQAKVLGKIFGLTAEEQKWLQVVPYKGSLPTPVPTDPLIYRWYEVVSVYGTTIKELIHEEFGDGIMSAIDFSMDIQREADPKGDRVKVVLSGKFLPYKQY